MNIEDIKALGIQPEELQQRVIDRICEQIMESQGMDENGDMFTVDSSIHKKLAAAVKTHVDSKISEIAAAHILPRVSEFVETLTLQEANKWGEAKGARLTFTEYLVSRAEAYIMEQVDWEGKAKGEKDGYSWTGRQTRITHLINSHLHNQIETAMKEALALAVGTVAKGIHETARLKLNEIAAGLKVSVTTK